MTSEYSFSKVFGRIFGSYGSTSTNNRTSNGSYTCQCGNGYYIPKSIRKVTITLQTEIPAYAFQNCDLIEEIQIPELTAKIGNSAFYYCEKLNKLNSAEDGTYNLPKQITQIEGNCFYYNKLLQKMNCGDLTSVGNGAFSDCVLLQSFESSALQTIGESAFSKCTMLGSVQTGDVLQTIDQSAFNGCTALLRFNSTADGKVVIPDAVTSIGSGAFKGCNAVEDMTLPFVGTSMTSEYSFRKVFGHIFGSYGSASYNNQTSNGLYTCQCGNGYYIPKSIRKVTITLQTEIPAYAFQNCDLIEEIILPTTFVSAGTGAFTNCSATISYTAKSSVWDGTSVAEVYAGGSGTSTNPYTIATAEQLAFLAAQVKTGNQYKGIYFSLSADINLGAHMLVIGDKSNAFYGVFNGNGHSIYNYQTSQKRETLGLFAYNAGTICKLTVKLCNVNITSDLTKDVIFGGIAAYNSGTIENCYVKGTFVLQCAYKVIAGGVVGVNSGTIHNCLADGTIICSSTNFKAYAGGITGQNMGNISGCVVYNSVSVKGMSESLSYIGSIAGENIGDINSCYRFNRQVLTKFGAIDEKADEQTLSVTEAEMLEYCKANWGNEWDYSSSRPKLRR